MAYRAAGIGGSGDSLSVTAGPVLANQHLAVFSLYRKHPFSADRTFGIGQVIMAKLPFSCFNLPQKFLTVVMDFFHKCIPL